VDLLLIRHGQVPTNIVRQLETRVPGPELTELGRDQAEALVAALVAAPVDAIAVSPLVRTRQTAAPIAARLGLDPIELPGLREIEAGVWEGRSDPDARSGYMGPIAAWVDGRRGVRIEGAIDGHEFLERFDAAVAELERLGHDRVAVVSSGAAIRAWVGLRDPDVGLAFVAANELANGATAVMTGSGAEGWRCTSWEGAELPTAAR
jgi:broad specificity phosphatase PhoE